jgi:hypothetical protein
LKHWLLHAGAPNPGALLAGSVHGQQPSQHKLQAALSSRASGAMSNNRTESLQYSMEGFEAPNQECTKKCVHYTIGMLCVGCDDDEWNAPLV